MHSIQDYAEDIDLALYDAANDPVFTALMDPTDFETIAIADGNVQEKVTALSRQSAQKVINKIILRAKAGGHDIRDWICSRKEFDLCSKLDNWTMTRLMVELHQFLEEYIPKEAEQFAEVFTIAVPALDSFLRIFAAVGLASSAFVSLCNCPKASVIQKTFLKT